LPKEYPIPRGFRDFPPELAILRKKVLSRIEKIFIRYGFDPIETPAVELWETLSGKYGEEAENKLIFRFKDPFDNIEYGLRYDLTVPLARFVSSYSLPIPFKRYHIGPVWRRELKPKKGRYREFLQCDADIVGSPYPEADAEIVNLIVDIMKEFGFNNFRVKVNDRRILAGFFEEQLGLGQGDLVLKVYREIDKLDKEGIEGVKEGLRKIGLSNDMVNQIMEITSIRGDIKKGLEIIKDMSNNELVNKGLQHLEEMMDYVDEKEKLFLDLSMVRGLDYYTGPIFETVVDEPKIGSLTGGGRYDNLIALYGGPELPATGTSIGVERLIDAGIEIGLFKLDETTYTKIYIVNFDRETHMKAWKLARKLREKGIPVQVDLMRRKIKKQQEYTQKKGIPILVFIGRKELESNKVTVYIREEEERLEIPFEEFVDKIESLI